MRAPAREDKKVTVVFLDNKHHDIFATQNKNPTKKVGFNLNGDFK